MKSPEYFDVFLAEDNIGQGTIITQKLTEYGITCDWHPTLQSAMEALDTMPDFKTEPSEPLRKIWALDANLSFFDRGNRDGKSLTDKILFKNLGGILLSYSAVPLSEAFGENSKHFYPVEGLHGKDPILLVDTIRTILNK